MSKIYRLTVGLESPTISTDEAKELFLSLAAKSFPEGHSIPSRDRRCTISLIEMAFLKNGRSCKIPGK